MEELIQRCVKLMKISTTPLSVLEIQMVLAEDNIPEDQIEEAIKAAECLVGFKCPEYKFRLKP